MNIGADFTEYLSVVSSGSFTKIARLRFLNADGTTAFVLDNNPKNKRAGAFIQDGNLNVNLQNGMRRKATITLSNLDGDYNYNINKVWFGQQIALDMGVMLSGGREFYLPQGVFYVSNPEEAFQPRSKTAKYNLVDKWAYLDGSLFGNLMGTMKINIGENILQAIADTLLIDRFSAKQEKTGKNPIDGVSPILTSYYNGKTVIRKSDGALIPVTDVPYTFICDDIDGTLADVLLGLNEMLVGVMGYNASGHFVLDPSQDDISDLTKPVLWQFSPDKNSFLGATYSVKNGDVYNDIIVSGQSLSNSPDARGRATNNDPASDTNVMIIGHKCKRISKTGFYADKQCEDFALWTLKKQSVLQKSVSIRSTQLFHLAENNLIAVKRIDKDGSPIERHLLTGYTLPIGQTGEMTLSCTSIADLPVLTGQETEELK